jgi:DNA-binding NarL/FixJ family response regulator
MCFCVRAWRAFSSAPALLWPVRSATPRNSLTEEFPRITILLLSAHIEVEHAMELLASGGRVRYLLKSRVTEVEEFYTDAEPGRRGGAMIDPSLVHELVPVRRRDDPLAVLSPRQQEVLAFMAEGRSNTGPARQLWVTEGTVEKHVSFQ